MGDVLSRTRCGDGRRVVASAAAARCRGIRCGTPATLSMLEHRFAKLAAGATFLLLVIGGTVNPTGSSLACPAPTLVCHGQLFPPMVGGVLYEHGHRLAAMTVGLLQIGLTILLMLERRRLGALAMIVLAPRRLVRELIASKSEDKWLAWL